MAMVPETRAGKIQFYSSHLPKWAEAPESIGVTPEAVETLAGLVAEARAAYVAHTRAQIAARTATQTFHHKVREMHAGPGGGAYVLQMIKAFAASTDDPGVYSRASIQPQATSGRPGSAPPPGTPTGFQMRMLQEGVLILTWKCDNPSGTVGTVYHVRRELDGAGGFAFIGTAGSDKSFTDDTLPAGTRSCMYQVTALRSTRRGGTATYPVSFGGGGVRMPSSLGSLDVKRNLRAA
jgi:hypothetical protein